MSQRQPARPSLRGLEDLEDLERTPIQHRVKAENTYDALRLAARDHPGEPALIWLPKGRAADDPDIYSYARLFEQVTRTANLLHEIGVRPGRPVSFLMPNLPETHFLLWGGAAAGQANPVNPLLTPQQIAEIIRAAGSRTLVTTASSINSELFEKALEVRRLAPELDNLVVVGKADLDEEVTPDDVVRFDELLGRQPADYLISGRQIRPEDVAVYFHTGGTTGAPKLAQQTHWNQVCMAWIFAFVLDCGVGDRFLTGLPLFHANAAIASGLTPLTSGGTVVLAGQSGFRSKHTMADFWRIVERFRISAFSAVPTILGSLLDIPRGSCDVSSLRVCVCGAAPLAVSLFRAFEAATGLRILEAYGMTESTLCSTINPRDGERRIGSVGIHVPYHQVKTALLDADGGYIHDCSDGEVGVLLLKGDTVTPGYKQPEYNRRLWPQPGWFNSGDLARRDADGYFWLTGRAKDLIIRAGHNIDPAVIEEALHSHPSVEVAAAVGRPDPYAGEVPVAFVSLRSGATVSEDELREYAASRVPERPAAPAFVRIIDRIPTTAVGKIFKPALRELVVSETVSAVVTPLSDAIRVEVETSKTRGIVARIVLGSRCPPTTRALVEKALMRYPVIIDIVEDRAP